MKNMERCKTCQHMDREKSNDKWIVCGGKMPVSVMTSGISDDCINYKPIDKKVHEPQNQCDVLRSA